MSKWLKYFLVGVVVLLVVTSTSFLAESVSIKKEGFGFQEMKEENGDAYTEVDKSSVPSDTYATIEKNDYEVPRVTF